MIVADTNIIIYLFINGEYTDSAEKAFQMDTHWAAPLLWRSEFRNVLAFYIRKQILDVEDAIDIMTKAETLMKGNEYDVRSFNVLQLSSISDCSAYDCEFVALAKDLGIPLITMDKRILRNFPEIAIGPEEFSAE